MDEPIAAIPRETRFVGRDRELAALRRSLTGLRSGDGALWLLSGPPGIGKTRTCRELTSEAERMNASVLWGRCWEGGGAPSFWPWRQIVRAAALQHGEATDLLTHLEAEGAVSQAAPAQVRFHLLDSVAVFLKRAATREAPRVLILDDLHAADEMSLLLLQFLGREVHRLPMLLIGTYRPGEMRQSETAAELIDAIGREATTLDLRGLSRSATRSYLESGLAWRPSRSLLDAVYGRTEGNPLFLSEVLRMLVDRPDVQPRDVVLPEHVYKALLRRVDSLLSGESRILRVAAVIGRELDAALLEQVVSDESAQAIRKALSGSRRAGIVERVGHGDRYRFTHALIREALYEDIDPDERLRLHLCIGEALEAGGAVDDPHYLPALAHHFSIAVDRTDRRKALGYVLRTAEQARRQFSYENAARLYERALELLGCHGAPVDGRSAQVLCLLGDARWGAGRPTAARAAFARVATFAHAGGAASAELLTRAALGFAGPGIGTTVAGGGPLNRQLVSLLEDALAVVGDSDPTARCELLGRLAVATLYTGDPKRRIAASDEALRLARESKDPHVLARALLHRHFGGWSPHGLAERLARNSALIQLATDLNEPLIRFTALGFRVPDVAELGDPEELQRVMAAYTSLAEELRHPAHRFSALRCAGMQSAWEGRFERAYETLEEVKEAGEGVDPWLAALSYFGQRAITALLRSDLDEADAAAAALQERTPEVTIWRVIRAYCQAERGQAEAAQVVLDELVADDLARVPLDFTWLFSLTMLSDICVVVGDTLAAQALYERLLPHRDRVAIASYGGAFGVVARPLGRLAHMLGLPEEAQRHFEHALAFCEKMSMRPARFRTLYDYGVTLIAESGENAARAGELLTSALDGARELGMAMLETKIIAEREQIPELGLVRDRPRNIEPANVFRRQGKKWQLEFLGHAAEVKHRKGVSYIGKLLGSYGRDIHVFDLIQVAANGGRGIASEFGAVQESIAGTAQLDTAARAAYRARLIALREELEEAERNADLGREERLQREIELITAELGRAYGVARRKRAHSDPVEKARKAVLDAIRHAILTIEVEHASLGGHLRRSIRTGTYCAYRPAREVSWEV